MSNTPEILTPPDSYCCFGCGTRKPAEHLFGCVVGTRDRLRVPDDDESDYPVGEYHATMAIGWLAEELGMNARELYALWLRALEECSEDDG